MSDEGLGYLRNCLKKDNNIIWIIIIIVIVCFFCPGIFRD